MSPGTFDNAFSNLFLGLYLCNYLVINFKSIRRTAQVYSQIKIFPQNSPKRVGYLRRRSSSSFESFRTNAAEYRNFIGIKRSIGTNPTHIYLLKVSNGNSRTICEICSKLYKKIQEHANDIVLVHLLITLNRFQILF